MNLTAKERMQRAINYQPVDRIPTQVNYTSKMGQKMAAHFDLDLDALPAFLGNHMVRVDLSYEARFSDDGRVKFDWWGVGFDAGEEGYFAAVSPLQDNPDLDQFAWPDANDRGLLAAAEADIVAFGDEYFITPNLGFALFERAWSLRGFEQFFMDMATDPGYTGALLDRITEIQLQLIHRYLDIGVDGGYFGDDYGAQKSLLFSPRMWRRYIKPRLAKLFGPFQERGMPVVMHSDGQIQEILPDLVEIGLTTLNPVQPEVLDHDWLRSTFAPELSFYGGISTQSILPFGSPAEVQAKVAECIERLSSEETGLILAPSHRLMTDIPLPNVAAMLDAFRHS